jgi:putative phage-type endonuclease
MNATDKVVDRSRFIGSSDMAAILGLSPWATPYDVFQQKRGEAEPVDADPEKARLFRRGKRLEPVIVNMLEEERGLNIVARNQRYTDPEFDFLRCEVDAEALIDGEHVNVECKSAHPFTAWKYGAEGTDETPIEYTVQAMFSLMLTGRKRCIFGVLFGTDNLVVYELARDEEVIAEMRKRAVAFWREHILTGTPPAPISLPDVERMLRREPPKTIEASPEVAKLIADLENLRSQERAAHEGVDDRKFEIGKAVLGATALKRDIGPRGGVGQIRPTGDAPQDPHVILVDGEPRLQISLLARTGIDSEMVRTEYPEVAAACITASPYLKFGKPPKPKSPRRRR